MLSRSEMNCGRLTEDDEGEVQSDLSVERMKGEGFRKRSSWGVKPWREWGRFRAK